MPGNVPAERREERWSRRRFLRSLVGAGGAVAVLAGCVPSGMRSDLDAEPVAPPAAPTSPKGQQAVPTALPSAIPSPAPSPMPTETLLPSPTPVIDLPLFDAATLAPVYVAHHPDVAGYPMVAPFDPDERYPEYPYPGGGVQGSNGAYWLVRQALALMSPQGFGTAEWNPLGGVIQPGDVVLIKPNLVDDSKWENGQTTHTAFLRPVIDYAYRACGPGGQILVAEGPWSAGIFDGIVTRMGIRAMVTHLAEVYGVPVTLQDLNKAERGMTPLVDLGAASALQEAAHTWFDAHGKVIQAGGDPGIGRYYIAPAVLDADVVLSVPKLKVHCSGGITVTMKNMLGIIPAWDGPYERAELKDCAHTSDVDQADGRRGMYLDNDTIWRSMADLNRILLYCDRQGQLQATRQRRYLTIVDGILAAEASQYDPRPYPLSTVVVGANPVTVDAVSARCMGFDPRRLKSVVHPSERKDYPLGPYASESIRIVTGAGVGMSTQYRRAITPELGVFSWQGEVEAEDFDAPEIHDWQWNAADRALYVACRDTAGVAWVRVSYTYEDQRRTKDLVLHAGNPMEGQWRVEFALGGMAREVTLEAGDVLYNQTVTTIEL